MMALAQPDSTAPASTGGGIFTRKRVATGALLAMVGLGLGELSDWRAHHALLINASQSLPDWAFLVERGRFPSRGDFVVFAPGYDPLVRRHFGARPPAFVKIAYGVPGDRVDRAGHEVRVNGRTVARLKPRTRQGEVLVPGPLGTVPKGCVFTASPHKDGFDSRYAAIGFVCRDRLIGSAEAIL
ncbi:S26 family signal peptidase [Novosphingobium olei]|nr:S26 family signal peptidase [Novosphingobium olei]